MSRGTIWGRVVAVLVLLLTSSVVRSQGFEFVPPASVEDPAVPGLMRDLAERILPVYQEKDPERYLVNLAALQMVAGNPGAAAESRNSLRERRETDGKRPQHPYVLFHDLVVRARAVEQTEKIAFADAFARLFRENVSKLGDRESNAVTRLMGSSPEATRDALQAAFDRIRPAGSVGDREAMDLVWTYIWFDAYRRTGGTLPSLAREEGSRRYVSEEDVRIKGRGGVEIVARVVRPRVADKPLPALLEFTIDPAQDDAAASAAHGYVGVIAYTRGKLRTKGRITPFENDGEDARLVIEWIAKQPWSDGRVAMIGEGYSGFAAWAATRKLPAALKAIATADATAPGIDFPMEGRIVRNQAYRWASEHTQGLADPAAVRRDDAGWQALDLLWFQSGRPYRDFDRIAKEPNRVFRRWIGHPSYDRYWQKMIPFREQFAKVQIPVLSITGYYAQGEVGALHYFQEHVRHAPDASHALLIGPWDERAIEDRPARVLRGYAVDPASRIDLEELRFEWLDHVLNGRPKPEVLKDRVNYWAMGAGQWRHASSVEAMGSAAVRLYLETSEASDARRLFRDPTMNDVSFEQVVDRRNRDARGDDAPPPILSRQLPVRDGVKYISDPLPQSMEVSGLLSGQLDFRPSRMDVDLNVAMYELLADGGYLLLFDPYEFRASYARDRSQRRLLQAGVRQQLKFRTEQLMARRLHAGSRLVLVMSVNQRADRQINYGIGDDVSAESLKRAKAPLKIRWYPGSYIELPVRP
ncbi:hypothetical protein DFR24_4219 [Panacagrimonas perspica]|uniref:Xaa-Pro dipeptidyl-peptidase C-terminal domain-containing protein n=1 Tax=Panacagrimonas perspica TaxID=381431 RepID=A0A4R7NX13_9GAMM|nr:CocE/NonD family hydrolase [Panacagrimonas perspica]TDU25774.1 hypothetical protein DFR24_4219 [Panacagrimonas perspica]THD02848.1 hypothetical protein B1810_13115 [Panacagrimonas perspica]